jgi:hypothetical protein
VESRGLDVTEITLVKLPDGKLRGMSERDQLAYSRFKSRLANAEAGEVIEIEAKLPRNSKHHRKYFALLNLGYEHFESGRKHKTYKGKPVTKSFESFREEVLILAGFYEQTFTLKGELKLEAKSIKFASMEQPEFEDLYSKTINVLLEHVLTNYKGADEINDVVEKVLRFA